MSAINTIAGSGSFEDVIEPFDPEIQAISKALRAFVARVMPGVTEVLWLKQKSAGYGVGPKKNSEHFCYIAPFKKHVNLGFFYGADLADPDDLMEGAGKSLRHIKVRALEQAKQKSIRTLLQAASKHLPKLKKKP